MSQTTLNEGAPSVDLPQALVQFYASTTPEGLDVSLEAADAQGDPLGAPQWTFQYPRWVLDARGLTDGAVDVRVKLREGLAFPRQSSLQINVKTGRREYLLRFADGELAGRAARDVVHLEGREKQLRMRRAVGMGGRHVTDGAVGPARDVHVIIDGSASMRSPALRLRVAQTLSALQDVFTGVRRNGSFKVGWAIARDGKVKALDPDDPVSAWEAEPASIGTAFEAALLVAGEDHLLVTDDLPDGIKEWTVPDGANVQIVMVGSATPWLTQDLPEGIAIIDDASPDDGKTDTAYLIAHVATALGWNE